MSVYQFSRYLKTSVFDSYGVPQLRIRNTPKINLNKSTTYIFKAGDRIDSVAYKIYGNAQLYWAILDANPQYFSELEIKPGELLVIPPFEEIVKNAL